MGVEIVNGAVLGVLAFLLVAGSMALWFRRIQRVEVPEDRRGFVACWAGGALVGIVALSQGAGWIAGIPAVLAALAGTFFSVLVYISPQKTASNAIRVGERLREFRAPDENGKDFAISSIAGKPILLKFFRGHWFEPSRAHHSTRSWRWKVTRCRPPRRPHRRRLDSRWVLFGRHQAGSSMPVKFPAFCRARRRQIHGALRRCSAC